MSYIDNVEEVIKKSRKVEEHYSKKAEKGFNAIFAVDSVPSAIEYYKEFMRQQDGKDEKERLKIATIFSYLANESDETGVANESLDEVGGLKKTEKEELRKAKEAPIEELKTELSQIESGIAVIEKEIKEFLDDKAMTIAAWS